MTGSRKLRFGVIGAGDFARVCHVPGLQSHPGAEVVAICGRRPDAVRSVADQLGVPDAYTDYEALCARPDIDGVTIVTPNAYHAEQAVTALGAGKHVFCEKPLAMNVAEAQAMVRAAGQSARVHQVAFTFRYLHGIRELKRRLSSGDIGEPYYARIQYDSWTGLDPRWKVGWQQRRSLAGGGILFELGSHLFDTMRFVFGPLRSVTGFVHNVERERLDRTTGRAVEAEVDDMAAALFVHESGVRGQWFISRVTPAFVPNGYLEVVGPEGAMKAALSRGGVDSLQICRPADDSWEHLPLPAEASENRPHCLNRMMRSFADACIHGRVDSQVDATFHDGLAVQEAMAAVTESEINLPERTAVGSRA